MTNDLNVIECKEIRSLLMKGPKFREPRNVNWDHFLTHFKNRFKISLETWVENINKNDICLETFKGYFNSVLQDIKISIEKIKKRKRFYRKTILSTRRFKDILSNLQKKFVFVPTDKAGNNIAVVCKVFYISQSLKELGIFRDANKIISEERTYIKINVSRESVINRHVKYVRSKMKNVEIPKELPYLYWIPKMHKKPISKQRYIAASGFCTTKPISKMLTKILKRLDLQIRWISKKFFYKYKINPYWILRNSTEVFKLASIFNKKKYFQKCANLRFCNIVHKNTP